MRGSLGVSVSGSDLLENSAPARLQLTFPPGSGHKPPMALVRKGVRLALPLLGSPSSRQPCPLGTEHLEAQVEVLPRIKPFWEKAMDWDSWEILAENAPPSPPSLLCGPLRCSTLFRCDCTRALAPGLALLTAERAVTGFDVAGQSWKCPGFG